MSSFFSRLLRSEKRPENPQGQGRENRKRHIPSSASVDSASEKSASLEKQQRVQEYHLPIFQPDNKDDKACRKKDKAKGGRHDAVDKTEKKRKNQKAGQAKSHHNAFSSLFCMSGNTDTLERKPLPAQKDPSAQPRKPIKIGGSVADKVVKRHGKKIYTGKFRHSAPNLSSLIMNGIEDEVAKFSEQGEANNTRVGSPRGSCSSPVQYRFDGTLQRPYVFPGGLTFLAGTRKNGKQYCISPDKMDPAERAKLEVSAIVHDGSESPTSLPPETPVHHEGGRTSWVSMSPGKQESGRLREEDVRKQFTLKYDDGLSSDEIDQVHAHQTEARQSMNAFTFPEVNGYPESNANAFGGDSRLNSFPLRKGVSLEILNDAPGSHSSNEYLKHTNSGRYSVPQRDPSCVYMGSFKNLTLLTLQRNNASRSSKNESDYFKSKQNLFKKGKKCHYSLPTLNHDFVCMGSMNDTNIQLNKKNGSLTSDDDDSDDDDSPSRFQRHGLGRCSTSMPDLSNRLVYTIFDLPPVVSDSEDLKSSDSEDDEDDNKEQTCNSHFDTNIESVKGKTDNKPQKADGNSVPFSPFSRNLGRASCMPGNKRFFIPPPPCFTPPKEEMESVQKSMSKLSCNKGSQIDLTVGELVLYPDMEERDQSLKRTPDVRRLSSSLSESTGGEGGQKPLSLPAQENSEHEDECTGSTNIPGFQDHENSHNEQKNKISIETDFSSTINANQGAHINDNLNEMNCKCLNEMECTDVDTNSAVVFDTTSENKNIAEHSNVLDNVSAIETIKSNSAVTSTPKSFRRKAQSDLHEKCPSPALPPKPVPRQRKSLLKSKSMCVGSTSISKYSTMNSSDTINNITDTAMHDEVFKTGHDDASPETAIAKPVPRKRRNVPRPQSEIIETTSFSDYMKEQRAQPSQATKPLNDSLQTFSEGKVTIPEDLILEKSVTKANISCQEICGAPLSHQFSETLNTIPESSSISPANSSLILAQYSQSDSQVDTQPTILEPSHISVEPSSAVFPQEGHRFAKRTTVGSQNGTHFATPGPIKHQQKSYRMAIERASLMFDSVQVQQTDSSSSNDEDMNSFQKGSESRSRDEDQCAADDEMSNGEEEGTSDRAPELGGNVIRGGSILDRSLILANKHRQRMRERKCTSQLLSSTETDDAELPSGHCNSTSRPVRKAVSFAHGVPLSSNNCINKSADSGTFSDMGGSPSTSPVSANAPRVSFGGNISPEGNADGGGDDDVMSTQGGGVKRQSSVQKKGWEVRLRRKHWMRRTGARDNVYSWHCGPEEPPTVEAVRL